MTDIKNLTSQGTFLAADEVAGAKASDGVSSNWTGTVLKAFFQQSFAPGAIASETLINTSTDAALTGVSLLDSSTAGVNVDLADGTVIGADKTFVTSDHTNASTVTVDNHAAGGASEVFTFPSGSHTYLILRWMGDDVGGWITIDATATV